MRETQLADSRLERLERLWFVYGNHGSKTTPGNHQFIQGLLEHGLDLRPLHTRRTPKCEKPTEECEQAVEAVLASGGGGTGEAGDVRSVLRLVPSPESGRKPVAMAPEMRELLDDIRRRHVARRTHGGLHSGGEDAA